MNNVYSRMNSINIDSGSQISFYMPVDPLNIIAFPNPHLIFLSVIESMNSFRFILFIII
jgi:hypothetical protein